MMRRAFLVAFSGLAALAASGCTTQLLLDAARKPIVTEYLASHVKAAWWGENGDLVVCFYGWPTGRPVSGLAQPYTMTLPAGGLESLAVPAGGADNARADLTWSAATEDIVRGCRDRPDAASPVAVRRYSVPVPGSDGQTPRKLLYELLAPADLAHPGPVIYSRDDAGGYGTGIIVYQHDAPLPGGARFVRLDPPYEKIYEYNAAIVALPLALVVDTALILGFLYICIQAPPGSC